MIKVAAHQKDIICDAKVQLQMRVHSKISNKHVRLILALAFLQANMNAT